MKIIIIFSKLTPDNATITNLIISVWGEEKGIWMVEGWLAEIVVVVKANVLEEI